MIKRKKKKSQGRGGADDYWSEDYDQSQNCAKGERIAEIRAKVQLSFLHFHSFSKCFFVLFNKKHICFGENTTFYFSHLVPIRYFFAGAGGKCGDGHESVLQQNGCNSLDDNHSVLHVYVLLLVTISVYL